MLATIPNANLSLTIPGEEAISRVEHSEVRSGAGTHVQHVVGHNPGMSTPRP